MAHAVTLPGPADFCAWREAARRLLGAQVPPAQAEWRIEGEAGSLFADAPPPPGSAPAATVPRAFLALAEVAIRHRDPERFALLYGLQWRLTHGTPALLRHATDPAVLRAEALAKAVRRDAHKMHAFLRFREVETHSGPHHLAWFEPDHYIEEAEASFFLRRFAALRWTIVTPRVTSVWDGEALAFGPGGRRAELPADDSTAALWNTYFGAIFNPARLKPGAMRAEMPKKYWRNLPEAAEIPRLMAEAPARVAAMVARGGTAPNPRPQQPRHLTPKPAP